MISQRIFKEESCASKQLHLFLPLTFWSFRSFETITLLSKLCSSAMYMKDSYELQIQK